MKWFIIFTVTFVMLSRNVMGFGYGLYFDDDSSSSEESSSSQEILSSEESSSSDDSSSSEESSSLTRDDIQKKTNVIHSGSSFHNNDNSGILAKQKNLFPILYYENGQNHQGQRIPKNILSNTRDNKTLISTTEAKLEPITERIIKPKPELTTERIEPKTEFTAAPTTDTMRDFLYCIQNCPVGSDYNPVCGTNLVTYPNPERLNCAKRCGLEVDILRASPCPRNIAQTILTTQSPHTTTTIKTYSKTTSESFYQTECINTCDHSDEWRPVCGSNDITYKNAQSLLCAQYCGVAVMLKKFTPCAVPSSGLTSSTTPRSVETVLNVGSTQSCFRSCSITSEHNPVCGTNNVTYKNPSVLRCLRTCGISVQMKHNLPCRQENNAGRDVVTSTPSQQQLTNVPNKSNQENCIDTCLKNLEYKPVCGSNNKTYRNVEHLQCAITCQVGIVQLTISVKALLGLWQHGSLECHRGEF